MVLSCGYDEQRQIFDFIWNDIAEEENAMHQFFIEGRPGRGKTFLIQTLLLRYRAEDHIILIVGTSALSAIAYPRGRTAHYMFGIPVTDDNVDLHSKIGPFSSRADLIRAATAIIWDELPMANKAAWECVHHLCCMVRRNHHPFGGIPFIGIGDFRQVAPVVKGCGETATLAASVKSSPLWQHLRVFTLTTPIRTISDPEYTTFVDSIGEDTSGNRRPLPLLRSTTNVDDAANFLFPNHVLEDPQICLTRAFLSPRHILVDNFNHTILDRLQTRQGTWCNSSLKQQDQHKHRNLLQFRFS